MRLKRLKRRVRQLQHSLGLDDHGRLMRARRRLARRYIRGRGIEIGALHEPLPVSGSVVVDYVDRRTRQESIAEFPELDSARIVEPAFIEDGFELASAPVGSVDFVIANHVLEHSSRTLQTLQRWVDVLAPNGILFIALPLAEHCFDREREPTSLEHLVEDHRLLSEGRLDELRRRDREHYREWLTKSVPTDARDRGEVVSPMTPVAIACQVDALSVQECDIHFHTFSRESARKLMAHVADELGLRVVEISVTTEIVTILRKSC